jgi:hypothetical protein
MDTPKLKALTAQVAALELEVMRLRDVIFDMAGEEPDISFGKADKVLSTHPFTPTALPELIEKVEQRVSESCAALCDHLQTIQQFGENGYGCEAAITRGEWRKFVKEV